MKLREGESILINLDILKKKIADSGMNIDYLTCSAGMNKNRLIGLLSGKVEFRASEMVSLSQALCLTGEESESVFFGVKDE